MRARYEGQGEPLPHGINGAWIKRGSAYLRVGGEQNIVRTKAGFSIPAELVASKMGLTVDQLLDANRTGALRLRSSPYSSALLAEHAIRLDFEAFGARCTIRIESPPKI